MKRALLTLLGLLFCAPAWAQTGGAGVSTYPLPPPILDDCLIGTKTQWVPGNCGTGGGMKTDASNAVLPNALNGLGIGPTSTPTYELNLSLLNVLQYTDSSKWAGGAPWTAVVSGHGGANAFLGYTRADGVPSGNLPSGVTGQGDLITSGNETFGVYGHAFCYANGSCLGSEFTSWSMTQAGDAQLPPRNGSTVQSVANGVNVTCGDSEPPNPTSYTCSIGVAVGSNGGPSAAQQFATGIWVSNYTTTGIVIGAPQSQVGYTGAGLYIPNSPVHDIVIGRAGMGVTSGDIAFLGATSGTVVLRTTSDIAGSGALLIPTLSGDTTLATTTVSQTLTNKTLTAPVFGGTITGTYTLAGTPTLSGGTLSGNTVLPHSGQLGSDGSAALFGGLSVGSTTMISSSVNFTNGGGAQAATLANGKCAGNPNKWVQINDNGTVREIPTWSC